MCLLVLMAGAGQAQDFADRARGLNPFEWTGLSLGGAGQPAAQDAVPYTPPSDIAVPLPQAPPPLIRFRATEGPDTALGVFLGPAGIALSEATTGQERNFFVGVGVDIRLTDRVRIGGEVLYDTGDDFRGAREAPAAAAARVTFSF